MGKTKNNLLSLNITKCDYITLTSFNPAFFDECKRFLENRYDVFQEMHKMQYYGKEFSGVMGRAYLGVGLQKGNRHYILQIGGEMADASLHWCSRLMGHDATCKRFDAQMTVLQPDGWSQWNLLKRLHAKGHDPRIHGTEKSGLQTIYIGARKESARYTRIYQKKSVQGILLRLEVEMKEGRAAEFGRMLHSRHDGVGDAMEAEILKASKLDNKMGKLFSTHIEKQSKPIQVKSLNGNTLKWLEETCLPALEMYINSHDSENVGRILDRMCAIIERYERYETREN
jgi:hypothetical protein